MTEAMHPFLQGDPHPLKGSIEELPPYSRLPRLDLGIDWESPAKEFRTSVWDFFAGPRPLRDSELPPDRVLRVDWIRGKLPGRAFLASCLWHALAIWLLTSPIWGFLPAVRATLAPVQIEYTLYDPQDLPRILLPSAAAKPSPPPKKPDDASQLPPERGADAYHPRQTILSIPVRVTHPRQTLIEPDAPPTPPKVVPQLPNIVQWTEKAPPKLQIPVSPTAAAPVIQRKTVRDVAVPEVANAEKNTGPLNIASSPVAIARPQIPLNPMSAPAARERPTQANPTAAPEIGASSESDANLRRLIALSATPGPPAPEVNVPEGNLAARISMGPAGTKPGAPGGAEHGSSGASEGGGASAMGAAAGAAGSSTGANSAGNLAGASAVGGAGSLPAAISISGGSNGVGGGGGATAGIRPGRLNLKPMAPLERGASAPKTAAEIAAFDPSLPPEKILSGKEVYTLHVNLPNLTSASGSWILNFAQLDEDTHPPFRPKGQLSGPEPIAKADPEYPPEMIKEHVHGEVVLYAIIRKDGSVDSIQIVRGLEPQLDRNAIAALAKWKFRPGARAGVPVDLEAVVHIPFLYQNPRDY
ncbi:MAG: TonB family protein [Candidatus Acidiferrales bacterium]|jgi:protein TonB